MPETILPAASPSCDVAVRVKLYVPEAYAGMVALSSPDEIGPGITYLPSPSGWITTGSPPSMGLFRIETRLDGFPSAGSITSVTFSLVSEAASSTPLSVTWCTASFSVKSAPPPSVMVCGTRNSGRSDTAATSMVTSR